VDQAVVAQVIVDVEEVLVVVAPAVEVEAAVAVEIKKNII
jgi:hypothetical protein